MSESVQNAQMLRWKRLSVLAAACMALLSGNASAELPRKIQKSLEKLRKEEAKEKADLVKKLEAKRAETVNKLEELVAKYRSQGKTSLASKVQKKVEEIKKTMIHPPKAVDKKTTNTKEATKSSIVLLLKPYKFDHDGKIKGSIVFKRGNKVSLLYAENGKKVVKHWTWEDKKNHIFIKADSSLGPIYISAVPSSGQRSIMIRWGGTMKHETTKATAQ